MIPDYLKVIKLGYGMGEPNKQACWMTALNSHIGGKWSDQCDCVDPTINQLCIIINDVYLKDDEARTRDILEFGLFEPLGTKGSEEDSKKRYYKIFAWLATKKIRCQKIDSSWPIMFLMDELRYHRVNGDYQLKDLFELLRELIDMGPHAPVEQTCDIEKFHELVGAK